MEFLFLIIGVIIGAIVVWFIAQQKISEKYRAQIEEARLKANEWQTKYESYVQHSEEMNNKIQALFSQTANNALEKNNQHFMTLANEVLDKYMVKADSSFKKTETEVSNLVKPLSDSLKNFEKQNSELFVSMKSHIQNLQQSQKSLEKETYALVGALKNPKIRGRWGEIGLRRIVEFSGLNQYCDFEEQSNKTTQNKAYRPDMIIRMPEGKQIVVDSKVPLNAYLKSIETDNPEEEKNYLIQHAQAVKSHLQNLSAKEYWKQFDDSVDFVVLYMEVEPAFGAALKVDNELIIKGLNNRIIFATPSTFISILQSVAYSWKQQKSTENAMEIWKNVQTLHERLKVFIDHFEKIGKAAQNLNQAYNSSISSMEKRLFPVIRKIESLGSKSEKDSLQAPEELEE